jgi:hypothetical protein
MCVDYLNVVENSIIPIDNIHLYLYLFFVYFESYLVLVPGVEVGLSSDDFLPDI